jgi:hypothetical protein
MGRSDWLDRGSSADGSANDEGTTPMMEEAVRERLLTLIRLADGD